MIDVTISEGVYPFCIHTNGYILNAINIIGLHGEKIACVYCTHFFYYQKYKEMSIPLFEKKKLFLMGTIGTTLLGKG